MPAASDAALRRFRTALAFAAALAVLGTAGLAGCADFSKRDIDRQAGPFSKNNRIVRGQAPPKTPLPLPEDLPSPPPGPASTPIRTSSPTCLATAGLIPGDERGDVTIVAERTTGRIVSAKRFSSTS